jgi:hypothetical protein
MTLQELSAMITNGFEPMVEVHSIDPSIYLIFCCIERSAPTVTDISRRYPQVSKSQCRRWINCGKLACTKLTSYTATPTTK